MSEELRIFDDLCEQSREKSGECLTLAEQAERPGGNLEPKWEELVLVMRIFRRHSSNTREAIEAFSATNFLIVYLYE